MIIEGNVVPAPGGICEACFNDPEATHVYEYPALLVAYCRHRQTGGFIQMDLEEFRWTMFSPVRESAWRWFIEDAICDVIDEDPMHLFDAAPPDVLSTST